ncbi:MAG: asparagine synthase (glutamine-hydrolyzing) [Alphaproteobacteria bacterium]|nr:asparagine synthase (glutamine-hydrolyzing) [Alphaproteobacteria bacterium]
MCGIVGFVGHGNDRDLAAMAARLIHRGPDGDGYYTDAENAVFLGHRRLAILDLQGGHQPMENEDGQVQIVFNGEIYNCAELREILIRAGHVFKTSHSDTEVLVHGYEEWGADLPLRLNGMFAFAIFDRRRRRMFLARDRFGEKPLFYAQRNGLLVFASELGALAEHPRIERRLSNTALQKYFGYGYIPAPHALYEGTRKLPAGHSLVYEIASENLSVSPYWRFRLTPDERLGDRDEPRLVEELRHLLSEATRRRLLSDVPVGVFLSGGLDSSAVLAAAVRHVAPSEINTFTIGFQEPSYDESGPARRVATHFGTRHREEILDLETARNLMDTVLPRMDEPLGDPSIIPTYMLSRFARRHVTVALSGDGGDELFAGYDPMLALAPAGYYARFMPKPLHRLLRHMAGRMPRSGRNMSLDFKLKRTLMGLSYPEKLWGPVWMAPLDPAQFGEVFDQPMRIEDVYEEAITIWETSGNDPVDRMLNFFTHLYLPDDILTKVDRATMMCSLESRAIFLDNDLAEFCQRLPNRFKFRNGERKYLLKRALHGILPDDIINRKKKGFGMPVSDWLRTTPRQVPMRPVHGIRADAVTQRWGRHRTGHSDERLFLWSWLALQGVPGWAKVAV